MTPRAGTARPVAHYAALAGMTEAKARAILDAVDAAAKELGTRNGWVYVSSVAGRLGAGVDRTRARMRALALAGALEAEPPITFKSTGAAQREYRRAR